MTYEEMTVALRKAHEEWEVLNRKANALKEEAIALQNSSSEGYKGLTSAMAQINAKAEDEKAMWREYYSAKNAADEANKNWKAIAKVRREMKA